eukprot:Pompholyxophrys_punicea_v1_NODE_402_length_2054_cov_4.557279.p1 type:complete len:264 gc:universal NODE_402_length_2054_cov_4.557279:865-74(-)
MVLLPNNILFPVVWKILIELIELMDREYISSFVFPMSLKTLLLPFIVLVSKVQKNFVRNGSYFGWDHIESMCLRQYKYRLAEQNLMMDVPKLKAEYVYRDSWTRLNVTPAKIMQQPEIISVLRGYAETAAPLDKSSIQNLCEILEAIGDMFENCLLTSEALKNMSDACLDRFHRGFSVFSSWADQRLALFPDPNESEYVHNGKQTGFLHYQTWDELRVTYYVLRISGLLRTIFSIFSSFASSIKRKCFRNCIWSAEKLKRFQR